MRLVKSTEMKSPTAKAAARNRERNGIHAFRRPTHRVALAQHCVLIDGQNFVGRRFDLVECRFQLGEIELSCLLGADCAFLKTIEFGLIVRPRGTKFLGEFLSLQPP